MQLCGSLSILWHCLSLGLLSLGGAYGETAKTKALQLLREGLYDYVGTDLHRVDNVERMIQSIRLTKKERERLELLFENNKGL